MIYKIIERENAMGKQLYLDGPGFGPYQCGIMLFQPLNEWAQQQISDFTHTTHQSTLLQIVEIAYQAGQRAKARDIRRELGIR